MNTQLKVGDRVRVISGETYICHIKNSEGIVTHIRDKEPSIHIDFMGEFKGYLFSDVLEYEVLPSTPPTPPTPKWLPIDRDNLPSGKVVAIDYPAFNDVYYGTLELIADNRIRLYIGNGQYLYNFTHYISLTDLLNLPISE